MRMHLNTIGQGVPGDPIRVNLPTYALLEVPDDKKGTAYVEVPDDCLPKVTDKHDLKKKTHPVHGDVVVDANDQYVSDVLAHFDGRYREHAGEYSLDLVKGNG